jgi:hypothetical protein
MANETPPQPEDDANERFLRAVEFVLQTLRGQGRFHTADVVQRAIEEVETPRFRARQLHEYLMHDRFRLTSFSAVQPADTPDKRSTEHMIATRKALLDFLDQGNYDLDLLSMRDTVRLFGANKETIAGTLPEGAQSSLDFTLVTFNYYMENPDAFGELLDRFDIPHSETEE